MRVELSPLQRVELSLPSRRRRKPGVTELPSTSGSKSKSKGIDDENDHHLYHHHHQPIAISIVATPSAASNRPTKKSRKTHAVNAGDDKVLPKIVVTLEDCITTVGRQRHVTESRDGPVFAESQMLQYECRPGTRFLPKDKSLSVISAVLDSNYGRFYALQKENRRLVSWAMLSLPDEAPHSTLMEPALDLVLLEDSHNLGRSVVYGTLQNHALFVASCDTDAADQVISLQTFAAGDLSLSSSKARHIGTLAVSTPDSGVRTTGAGDTTRKRGLASSPENASSCSYFFYQVFLDRRDIVVVRHSISGLQSFELSSSTKAKDLRIPLPTTEVVDSATMIGMVESDRTVLLALRIVGETMVVAVCLATGNLARVSYCIPLISDARFSLVAEDMLVAACTDSDFFLFDAMRGALVDQCSLQDLVTPPNEPNNETKVLAVRAKKSTQVFLTENSQGKMMLAFRTLDVSGPMRLADSLSMAQTRASLRPQNVHVGTLASPPGVVARNDTKQRVERGLAILASACTFIRTRNEDEVEEKFLQQAFYQAARSTLHAGDLNSRRNHGNSKESFQNQVTDKLNGVYYGAFLGTKVNGVPPVDNGSNGKKQTAKSTKSAGLLAPPNFSELSTSFLNEAAFMIANLLISKKGDTKKIIPEGNELLKGIVQSRKMSARILLRGGGGDADADGGTGFVGKLCAVMRKGSAGEKSSYYSSTTFALDLIGCCRDVSESQMVTLLHFFLRYEDPKNIALFVLSQKHNASANEYPYPFAVSISKRYLALLDKNSKTEAEVAVVQQLSSKLIVTGISIVVKEMTKFSNLNGSLLRRSIVDTFSREELVFLVRLLSRLVGSSFGASATASRRHLQLLSAVCDTFRGFGSLSEEEGSAVKALSIIVAQEGAFTQELIPFYVAMRDLSTESAISLSHETAQNSNEYMPSSQVSEYQIERLVL